MTDFLLKKLGDNKIEGSLIMDKYISITTTFLSKYLGIYNSTNIEHLSYDLEDEVIKNIPFSMFTTINAKDMETIKFLVRHKVIEDMPLGGLTDGKDVNKHILIFQVNPQMTLTIQTSYQLN